MGWGEGEYEMLQSALSRVINSDGARGGGGDMESTTNYTDKEWY